MKNIIPNNMLLFLVTKSIFVNFFKQRFNLTCSYWSFTIGGIFSI